MLLVVSFLFLHFLSAIALGKCNPSDTIIYKAIGHTFPTLFRSYGGLYTSKASYEQQIVEHVKLSPPCASCYGDAYICGYDKCKWKCIREGESCDVCLEKMKCIEENKQCTGF